MNYFIWFTYIGFEPKKSGLLSVSRETGAISLRHPEKLSIYKCIFMCLQAAILLFLQLHHSLSINLFVLCRKFISTFRTTSQTERHTIYHWNHSIRTALLQTNIHPSPHLFTCNTLPAYHCFVKLSYCTMTTAVLGACKPPSPYPHPSTRWSVGQWARWGWTGFHVTLCNLKKKPSCGFTEDK